MLLRTEPALIMPRAIAMWLVENTALTFEQIANFCKLQISEVKAMADDEEKLVAIDPIRTGQISQETIDLCTKDPNRPLELIANKEIIKKNKQKRKYIPILRRQDKPNAISWILKNCPEMDDNHIIKLIGTTKNTIEAIRNKTHWNMDNIKPQHPAVLGLCAHEDFEQIIAKVKVAVEKNRRIEELNVAKNNHNLNLGIKNLENR
ncbi:DUF1013 domain-containing protein [Candidatus Xenohaliotis californiensis]|uniref:DUF1013 domain-containing protein n=1 Tax=Candidatus Xenohaliotis californiensis TaxID=84677 RepID=A0ABP0EV39_9RICK|nr:DUF1013 domain-containing protein [Candidatus Xenohaliotis californiensis]